MGKTAAIVSLVLMTIGCVGGENGIASDKRAPELDAVAAAAVDEGFPGVVIAVGEPGEAIRTGAAGLADRAASLKMTPHSRIHAASTTKAITAATTLLLVDRGALSLEATLPDLLQPEAIKGVPYAAEISVRHLLLHTSGLYSPNNDPKYLARYIGPERKEKPFWTAEEIIAFAADAENPPAFAPGGGRKYSDINYVLLSMIVSSVSGEPFKTFVQREIFDALGMGDSYFLSDGPDRPRARAYTVDSEILRSIGLDPDLVADESGFIDTTDAQEQSDGAAGIITTAPDLVRFARAFTQDDLLSRSSRALVLEVADRAKGRDAEEALGALRAYDLPYGLIVTAEGDGPGTNVVWVLHFDSNRIVAAAVNQFGRWDESDYLLNTLTPSALSVSKD